MDGNGWSRVVKLAHQISFVLVINGCRNRIVSGHYFYSGRLGSIQITLNSDEVGSHIVQSLSRFWFWYLDVQFNLIFGLNWFRFKTFRTTLIWLGRVWFG